MLRVASNLQTPASSQMAHKRFLVLQSREDGKDYAKSCNVGNRLAAKPGCAKAGVAAAGCGRANRTADTRVGHSMPKIIDNNLQALYTVSQETLRPRVQHVVSQGFTPPDQRPR